MEKEVDSLRVAAEASRRVWMQAQGHPARTIAYGVAAAVTFVGVGLGCYINNAKQRYKKKVQRREHD